MKFICTKENLSHSLGIVVGITSKQVNLPILTNVLFNVEQTKVEVIGTNLEIAVKSHLRAKVESVGSFTVPSKTLADFVNLLPDEQVEIEVEGNEMKIKCGNSSTKIKGTTADDFPVIPDIEEQYGFNIDVEELKDALSKTVIAVAKNEIRPELSGIFAGFFIESFAGLVLASTDSYRLTEKKIKVREGSETVKCIIPGRTAYELVRLLGLGQQENGESSVRVWVSENQIAARYNAFEMTSRLVDGEYPDYTQIIPGNFKTTATVPIDELVKKIKAASLFTTTGVNAVSFDLNVSQKTLGISSTSTQTGEHVSEIEAEITGEENSILLNHRYVLDGLQQMNGEVEFMVNSGDAPCMFREKGRDDYLYIVMPIRQ